MAEEDLRHILTEIRLMRAESLRIYKEVMQLKDRVTELEQDIGKKFQMAVKREVEKDLKASKSDRQILLGLMSFLAVTLAGVRFSASVENGSLKWAVNTSDNTSVIIEVLGVVGLLGSGAYTTKAISEAAKIRQNKTHDS